MTLGCDDYCFRHFAQETLEFREKYPTKSDDHERKNCNQIRVKVEFFRKGFGWNFGDFFRFSCREI